MAKSSQQTGRSSGNSKNPDDWVGRWLMAVGVGVVVVVVAVVVVVVVVVVVGVGVAAAIVVLFRPTDTFPSVDSQPTKRNP